MKRVLTFLSVMCAMANLLLLPAFLGIQTVGGSPGGSGNEPGCKSVREILTCSDLFVTSVFGEGAINAGIQIGMRLADVSLQLQAEVTAAICDAYKIICYENEGILCCTELDWTRCEVDASCPEAGQWGYPDGDLN
jgi:hypothetical protein